MCVYFFKGEKYSDKAFLAILHFFNCLSLFSYTPIPFNACRSLSDYVAGDTHTTLFNSGQEKEK